MGQVVEGAELAFWFWFAEVFTYLDEEGVVFVEELYILLEVGLE